MEEILKLQREIAVMNTKLSQVLNAIGDGLVGKKEDKIYDRTGVCKRLNINKPVLAKIIRNGEIEYSQKGRNLFFTETQVNDFLNKNKVVAYA